MGLRPGHCYTVEDRVYTRYAVRVPKKNFIGAVPGLKTRQFNMGNSAKAFECILDVKAKNAGILRDNALESTRTMVNRAMVKICGKDGFFIKLRVYPFHILRENKQAQGAHADRIQMGMSHSFGKAIGRAARVKKGKIIMSILCDPEKAKEARKAVLSVKSRVSFPIEVVIGKNVASIGTKPRSRKLKMVEEKEVKEAESKEEKKEDEKKTDAKKGSKDTKKEPPKKEAKKGSK
jgi:large subunit ribosomal protein L10e